jgi:hypothetical protein
MAIRAENYLLVGDYLSPFEIPFVDDLADYCRTLQRLVMLITADIERVIPGHGPPLSAEDACRIAREDLRYLDSITHCAERNDAVAALRIALPRAEDVVGMREHHRENCRKASIMITEKSADGWFCFREMGGWIIAGSSFESNRPSNHIYFLKLPCARLSADRVVSFISDDSLFCLT